MMTKRKIVYSVTLHEEVAEWLRGLSSKGKLSDGIAQAQAKLIALGIKTGPQGFFRNDTPMRRPPAPPPSNDARHWAYIERRAFEQSLAAFKAGQPLPDHAELDKPGTLVIRDNVLKRCREIFGWETGPKPDVVVDHDPNYRAPPPGTWNLPRPAIDGTDLGDPFEGNEPGAPPPTAADIAATQAEEERYLAERAQRKALAAQQHQGPTEGSTTGPLPDSAGSSQEMPGSARGPQRTVTDPGPMSNEERAEIAALEQEMRGPPAQTSSAPSASSQSELSTAAETSTAENTRIDTDPIPEPSF